MRKFERGRARGTLPGDQTDSVARRKRPLPVQMAGTPTPRARWAAMDRGSVCDLLNKGNTIVIGETVPYFNKQSASR